MGATSAAAKRRLALLALLTVVALSAACTSATTPAAATRTTSSRSVPHGAADLLATENGVVWSSHLKSGTQTVLRSSDDGEHWRITLQIPAHGRSFGVVATYFLDAHDAWAVQQSASGKTIVHRTVDGGRDWRAFTVPGRHSGVDQIGFTSPLDGWLLTVSDNFGAPDTLHLTAWRSHDGGASWTELPASSLPLQGLPLAGYGTTACPVFAPPHLAMTGGGTGWLTSGGCEHGTAEPKVWHTTDSGVTWTPVELPAPPGGWGRWDVLGRGGTEVGSVSVRGSGATATLLVPVAVGASSLVVERSVDGGRSWQLAGTANTRGAPTRTPPAELFDVIDARHWVVSGAGGLVETADAGRSWAFTRANLDDPEQPISFTSPTQGFRGGADMVAAQRTSDRGRTWTTSAVPAVGQTRRAWTDEYSADTLSALEHRELLSAGAAGLFRSHHRGATWTRQLGPATPVEQLDRVDGHTVFAITGDELLRSTDSGRRWRPIPQPDAGPATRVEFSSPTAGIASVGSEAFRTENGGRSWAALRLPGGSQFGDDSLTIDATPGALCMDGDSGLTVATHSGRSEVLASDSGDRRWHRVLGPSAFPAASTGEAQVFVAGCSNGAGWILVTRSGKQLGMSPAPTGYALLRTTDLGRTWREVLRSAHYAPHLRVRTHAGVAVGPVGEPGGLVTTPNPRSLWLSVDNATPTADRLSFSSTSDNGQHWITTTLPQRLTSGRLVATTAADARRAYALFASNKSADTATIFTTADAGHHWRKLRRFGWSG